MNTQIKICGLSQVEHVRLCAQLGVNAIGLVFYSKSPRSVSIEQAQQLCNLAHKTSSSTQVVGLFVNEKAEAVKQVLDQVPLDVLQFHGHETDDYCRQFFKPFWKALKVGPATDVAQQISAYPSAVAILLDTAVAGVEGGSGKSFDWSQVPAQGSASRQQPLWLAGGLTSSNVAGAIEQVKPAGVDVSGGVEFPPDEKQGQKGHKDSARIEQFVNEVRCVAR